MKKPTKQVWVKEEQSKTVKQVETNNDKEESGNKGKIKKVRKAGQKCLLDNFPDTFVKWIMTCVQTISYTILVNGKATTPFVAKREVKQGDPLSPYLFVIAIEYLTRLLKTLKNNPDFNYHPRCAKLNLVQLGFADNLLLFCRGDVISAKLLYACFESFSKASSLVANQGNNSIYLKQLLLTYNRKSCKLWVSKLAHCPLDT
ncbi:PREDICTED: uncharacterized protein LOC109244356 [Nicotiana attenuata]|uniref:uncharacterized protein LOC109244356 n=1 Tax=Nicotiana attenuata TaxID=49451 RepID=UPI000905A9C9|nr:PREDICTED: uncharacterized protein LOC109244356 [Nicotiana attenuata]